MKRIFLAVAVLLLSSSSMFSQSFLTPANGYITKSVVADYSSFSIYDFYENTLFAGDGSSIYSFNIDTEELLSTYDVPAGAGDYASFINISSDGTTIWTGFSTSGNVDDRIYSIDVISGEWTLRATFPANFDMAFLGENILISGLNSSDWEAVNSIFLLDLSGDNNHRKIIEIEGSASGLAVDASGNVYNATSVYGTTNNLYRWSATDVAAVIANSGQNALTVNDATVLSEMPSGAYDCDVDAAGNVIFDFNEYGAEKVLALWNGTEGNGNNYNVIASTTGEYDWLGLIKSRGNIMAGGVENEVITSSFGSPIASVYRDNVSINENTAIKSIVNVYPNPSNGIFNITSDKEIQSVVVYNMMGQMIYSDFSSNQNYSIDLFNFGKGSYIIKLQQGSQSVSRTVIVK